MKSQNIFNVNLILAAIALISFSCSSYKEINKTSSQNINYLNTRLLNEKYNNVSLGILLPDVGLDTINVDTLLPETKQLYFFDKSLIKQFPIGLTYFANFSKVEWIYYNPSLVDEYVEKHYKNDSGEEGFFMLPFSSQLLMEETKYDFLMHITAITAIQINPEQTPSTNENGQKYKTQIIAQYCILNRRSLGIITINKISIISEFEKLPEQWPYKNAVMKLAASIIEDLPMFKK